METKKLMFQIIGKLKPKLSKDGNMWCFLYGRNMVQSICGFGKTPFEAAMDFCNNFMWEEIIIQPSTPVH